MNGQLDYTRVYSCHVSETMCLVTVMYISSHKKWNIMLPFKLCTQRLYDSLFCTSTEFTQADPIVLTRLFGVRPQLKIALVAMLTFC